MQESGLKPFLWYAPQLSGASIVCFSPPELPWGSLQRVAAFWWLLDGKYSSPSRVPLGLSSHWRAAIGDDYDILVYWYGRKYPISQYQWPQICRWHHPYGRKWRGTKKPLESEKGEWKIWLKAQHSENEVMASGPITSWEIDGEPVETVLAFMFLGSKITADGDCSHEIKRHFLLGRKVMTNLDSMLKTRDITLPTKVRLVKAMVFPVVMYGC